MKLYARNFQSKKFFDLVPLGDWHMGSRQCDESFIRRVVDEIKSNPDALWVGMGDFMENAIIGSKSDMYTQTMPPKEQMDYVCDILEPIKKKGLFLIAGNHEQRTMRQVGIVPEGYIGVKLGLPFMGFSCMAVFNLPACKTPYGFTCYFHHNYGGGFTSGGKINRAESLRKIVPTADAIFSGHFHITSRIPVSWFEAGRTEVNKKTGYDYITGSALSWNESYAEEKGKPASSVEHIRVRFVGGNDGKRDMRRQEYFVIS
ncbi:MAG: metallophosphoesterase [Pseudomonadota bacterium]